MAKYGASYGDWVVQYTGGGNRVGVNRVTGETISYRQFDKLRHEGKTYGQRQREAPTIISAPTIETKTTYHRGKSDYAYKLDTYTKHVNDINARNNLPPITKKEAMRSSEFKYLYQQHLKFAKQKKANTRADGPWADVLVDLGQRDDTWDWDVGDTPDNI